MLGGIKNTVIKRYKPSNLLFLKASKAIKNIRKYEINENRSKGENNRDGVSELSLIHISEPTRRS